jgi:peroxiredoxin
MQLVELQSHLNDFERRGVAVVAISVDPADVCEKLEAGLGLTFPIVPDVKHVAIDAYGVYDKENEISWPAVYVVERDRKIAWRFLGDNYKERPPANDVLQAIDRISAPRGP